MSVLFYPFIFTGEELRYDYGFPHAEWRRNPEAPGTKSNIEAANSKNKISRKVDEPFITVTRKKKLETLFKQTRHAKEKPDDSEKRAASTTQRKGKESEVPVEVVSKLHPTLSAKNLTIPLQPVSLQSYNQSSKVEKNNAADTAEKAPNPIPNVTEDTEPRIPPKSAQNESSKVEKNKITNTEEKTSNPLRKDGGTEPEISKSSQNQSSKVEKNKPTGTEEKTSNPLRKDGGTEPEISTKSSQNQSSKVERNKPTGTEEKAPNPLRKDGGTEREISTKSSQNQSSKVEKNNPTRTEEKVSNPLRKDGGTEHGIPPKIAQNQSSKFEKNKTNDTEEKALNALRKDGGTEPGISTKSAQNQSSKVEKQNAANTAVKAPKPPRKPKNVARSIESSYAKLTKLEERKPKTTFEAKNECVIPQKVSTISEKKTVLLLI